jgi:hypothetical protein
MAISATSARRLKEQTYVMLCHNLRTAGPLSHQRERREIQTEVRLKIGNAKRVHFEVLAVQ